jgi:hypothetical protein
MKKGCRLGSKFSRLRSKAELSEWCGRDSKRVASWGPYETNFDLYQRALARIRLLASGRVAYSGLALFPGTMNCIKAAGEITDAPLNQGIS